MTLENLKVIQLKIDKDVISHYDAIIDTIILRSSIKISLTKKPIIESIVL